MAQVGTARSGGWMHRPHLSHFSRHFLEMFAVMAGGMIVSAAIFVTVIGRTWDQATVEHPLASLLVIAAGMTVPMVAWMLHRGMGVRNSTEMGAAMAVPVFPFLCFVWFGVTTSAQCGAYCIVAIVAMVALMRFRRSEYSMEPPSAGITA